MKKIVIISLLFLLLSCVQENKSFNFIIMQVNDVYEIEALGGGKIGGMARVETLHKQLLEENSNTLLVHGGDFLNPSLLGTMKDENGKRYRGKQMIDVMNAMYFDLVVFGNHEFDLDYPDFQERLNESTFNWISTNAQLKTENGLSPFFVEKNGVKTDIPRTKIFELSDDNNQHIKVGFISSVINSNPTDYVDYGDLYQDPINANKKLQTEVDVVLGLTHLGLNQDKLLAKSMPNIPLILGGHEHTNMLIPVGETLISKADANAKTAYVHRISVDINTKEVTIESELVSLDESVSQDKVIARKVEQWNVLLDKKLKEVIDNPYEVIYHTDIPLDGRDTQTRSEQTNLGTLIAKSMFNVFDDVDCAFLNGGSIRIDDKLEGDITGLDIFRVLPFGGGINKVEMTGELLERTLNYGRLKKGAGAYLQRFNCKFNEDDKTWLVNGEPINQSKTYKVVMTDYLLLGLDIPLLSSKSDGIIKIYSNSFNSSANDIRKVVIHSFTN